RAVDTRARPSRGHAPRTRRRPTHGARVPRQVLAGIAGAVALVEGAGVAVGGARGPGRRLRIGRAGGPGARARLLRIALTRGRAAHHGRGLEAVGGTGRAGAGAALGHVADVRCRAALSTRGLERTVGVAAVAGRPVVGAIVALLGALDDAVPAAGRVGGNGRRPRARAPKYGIGGIGPRRGHGAE